MTLKQDFMKSASKLKAIAASLVLLASPAYASSPAPTGADAIAAQTPIAPSTDVIHQITFTTHKSSDLAERYSFIRQEMQPVESLDGSPFIEPPPEFPEYVKIAEISIPEKNLTFVALRVEGEGWCTEYGNCALSFYFLRENGEYDQLTSFQSGEESSYYITNDTSFSVVYCEAGTFRRWQLNDGALNSPPPMNQSGYFTYQGKYTHPDMKNACPIR